MQFHTKKCQAMVPATQFTCWRCCYQFLFSQSYCILQVVNLTLFNLNIWFYSFVLKLLPCLILTILTAFLITELLKVILYCLFLRSYLYCQVNEASQNLRGSSRHDENSQAKTTKLLSVILISFLVAEFPQVKETPILQHNSLLDFRVFLVS